MIKCTFLLWLACFFFSSLLAWEHQFENTTWNIMTSSLLGVACFFWSTLLIASTKHLKYFSDHHFHVNLLSCLYITRGFVCCVVLCSRAEHMGARTAEGALASRCKPTPFIQTADFKGNIKQSYSCAQQITTGNGLQLRNDTVLPNKANSSLEGGRRITRWQLMLLSHITRIQLELVCQPIPKPCARHHYSLAQLCMAARPVEAWTVWPMPGVHRSCRPQWVMNCIAPTYIGATRRC